MSIVVNALLGSLLAAGLAGAVCAQAVTAPPASAPMRAASKPVPTQSPAVTAAENAKEPGAQRPDERVIPQVSIPLKGRQVIAPATSAASAAVPGGINEAAARCRASRNADDRAACERAAAASEPAQPPR